MRGECGNVTALHTNQCDEQAAKAMANGNKHNQTQIVREQDTPHSKPQEHMN